MTWNQQQFQKQLVGSCKSTTLISMRVWLSEIISEPKSEKLGLGWFEANWWPLKEQKCTPNLDVDSMQIIFYIIASLVLA